MSDTLDDVTLEQIEQTGLFSFNLNREAILARLRKVETERDLLLAACEGALLHLNYAPLEYHNGVTDPTGTIDEGNVVGWRTHHDLVGEIEDVIAKVKGDQ